MAKIVTSVQIGRPQAEVFSYLTDLGNAGEWSGELVSRTYDGDIAVGMTGTDVIKVGKRQMQMPWTVTLFEPPARLVIEFGGTFGAIAAFSFQPNPEGTLVTCRTDLRPKGWWRLLAPVIAREGRRSDETQFRKAKEILESRAAEATGITPGGRQA